MSIPNWLIIDLQARVADLKALLEKEAPDDGIIHYWVTKLGEELTDYDPKDDGTRVLVNGEWCKPSKEFMNTVKEIEDALTKPREKVSRG